MHIIRAICKVQDPNATFVLSRKRFGMGPPIGILCKYCSTTKSKVRNLWDFTKSKFRIFPNFGSSKRLLF